MPTSYWWRLRLECRWLSVVGGFELGGVDVAEVCVQPAVVVPVDPFHRRVLDVIDRLRRVRSERTALADHLGLAVARTAGVRCVRRSATDPTGPAVRPPGHRGA